MPRTSIAVLALLALAGFQEGSCDACNPDPTQNFPCGVECQSGKQCDLATRTCLDVPNGTPPDTALEGAPPAVVTAPNVQFKFVASVSGATFECKVDGAAFTACSSPLTVTVNQGAHTFAVRAVSGGLVDPSPATFAWSFDLTAPDTFITTAPTNSGTTAVTIPFSSNEAGATFSCSFDGETPYLCNTEGSRGALTVGVHTFTVVATDRAGNVDPTPATVTWTVLQPTPTVCGPIYFNKHTSVLHDEMKPCLDQLALALQQDPSSIAALDGHRDATEASTIALQRANVTRDYLVTTRGIDPSRLFARDLGYSCPARGDPLEPSIHWRVTLFQLAGGTDANSVVEACNP